MSIRLYSIGAVFVLLTVVAPAAAQQRLGGEFQVNSYTTGWQSRPAVASDAQGDFVVVWAREGSGDLFGVFGQRFAASGNPLGGEFRVNTYTTGQQDSPAVASAVDGSFVVVWEGRGNGDLYGVFGQRFAASGSPLGGEFLVNSYTTFLQYDPAAASDVDGNFVVVWMSLDASSFGIFGQRFAASGHPLGREFRVNTYTTGRQESPAVASAVEGNFVVVWDGVGYGYPAADGVFGQRYDASGNALGGEFLVNTYTTKSQFWPAVGIDGAGDFVVVWGSGLFGFGYPFDILGQRFDSGGNAIGGEFQANTSSDLAYEPQVASVTDDEFVVVWENNQFPPFNLDVLGRRIGAFGQPIGGEFLVNTYTTDSQFRPAIASDAEGDFVVVWESSSQDGDYGGIFAQRFAGPGLHLAADGGCPGVVEATLSNAPPNSEVGIWKAENTNGFVKGGRLCNGTELELGEPFQLPPTWVIVDGEGNGTATLDLGRNGCNLEALALATCETSNVVQVP